MPESPSGNVVPINLTKNDAQQYVKAALKSEGKLALSIHAKERMLDRDISIEQVREILKQAAITEGPYKDPMGRWNCRFEGYAAGEGICVVVGFQFINRSRVVVITTFSINSYR